MAKTMTIKKIRELVESGAEYTKDQAYEPQHEAEVEYKHEAFQWTESEIEAHNIGFDRGWDAAIDCLRDLLLGELKE